MNSSAIFGMLILFGAVLLLVVLMLFEREKDYKIAMVKYECDMEAYNKAVALYGDPSFAAPAPVFAAPAMSTTPAAAIPAVSSGEVLLSGVDDHTAAMIIAILCDELGKNPAALRFKSITAL
ncbi:MAG TPA: hypothetical protein VN626_03800 [Clostridia bacterium]|nr:hypothetical protein [Clostridia bacterium]